MTAKIPGAEETLLARTIESCKKVFWFVFFFSCSINLLTMFMPIYTMQILDRVVTSGSVDTLLLLTLITFTAVLIMTILEGCRSLTMYKIGEWIETRMSSELIQKSLAYTILNPAVSGSQILRDMNTVKGFLTSNAIVALFDLPWAILFFILMAIINPTIAFFAFIGILIVIAVAIFNEKVNNKTLKTINDLQTRNYAEIEGAIRSAEIVESMGMGRAIVKLWQDKNARVSELQTTSNLMGTVIASVSKLLRIVLNTFILAGGIYITLSTQHTVGGILACSILMGRVMAPIDIIISSSKMMTAARASYARLQQMLIAIPLRNVAMELPSPIGHLEFDKVTYAPHGSNRMTIKGVSFEVPAGECVGVIGASGSGKSTLMRLLVGVWKPYGGVVRLDGGDVYTWNRDHFGSYVGYLPQDVELFNVTIKENIARLSDDLDPVKVVTAAKIAGVHDLILSLPNGYDTKIGPGQHTLSGGQKQRIGLARAFYGNVRLLVLDEPNSNLDQNGEQHLLSAITTAKREKVTVVFTTHKMNLLSMTDKILVMQDGMVAMYGPRDEVLQRMLGQQQAAAQAASQAMANAQTAKQSSTQSPGENSSSSKIEDEKRQRETQQKPQGDRAQENEDDLLGEEGLGAEERAAV